MIQEVLMNKSTPIPNKFFLETHKGAYAIDWYKDKNDALYKVQKEFIPHLVSVNQIADSLHIINFLSDSISVFGGKIGQDIIYFEKPIVLMKHSDSDYYNKIIYLNKIKFKKILFRISDKKEVFKKSINYPKY